MNSFSDFRHQNNSTLTRVKILNLLSLQTSASCSQSRNPGQRPIILRATALLKDVTEPSCLCWLLLLLTIHCNHVRTVCMAYNTSSHFISLGILHFIWCRKTSMNASWYNVWVTKTRGHFHIRVCFQAPVYQHINSQHINRFDIIGPCFGATKRSVWSEGVRKTFRGQRIGLAPLPSSSQGEVQEATHTMERAISSSVEIVRYHVWYHTSYSRHTKASSETCCSL